ncbi:MAG TPA: hypothetical protein VIM33_06560 [Gaiellaceae bacterium]
MSGRRRYPTWDEIADVRYELIPEDVTDGDAPAAGRGVRERR